MLNDILRENCVTAEMEQARGRAKVERPITVSVDGPRGSGKTVVLAIISQALENHGLSIEYIKPVGTLEGLRTESTLGKDL